MGCPKTGHPSKLPLWWFSFIARWSNKTLLHKITFCGAPHRWGYRCVPHNFYLSKIEPHKTKNTAAHKTTALKRCTLQNYRFGTQEESNKILRHKKNKPHHTAYKWLYNAVCGRSGENRTPGLDIPNVAPCQLGYTPIFMKFFSKWSNMWSDGFSTKISAKQKRRDGVVWKGMYEKPLCKALRRLYAPKCGALPTALHPDSLIFKSSNIWSNKFLTSFSPDKIAMSV